MVETVPRSRDRGPIEASRPLRVAATLEQFRDHVIAAPLKLALSAPPSTLIKQFRDHVIAATLKRDSSSSSDSDPTPIPRSRDRGPIEAHAAAVVVVARRDNRSEEHTSELQSLRHLVCRLLL